jgi:5-hydroxyisourate hydrolase
MGATLSTHVLDTGRGAPAAGIAVTVFAVTDDARVEIGTGLTGPDGRIAALAGSLEPGLYELVFATDPYFASQRMDALFDRVALRVRVTNASAHYHVPLLLTAFGYTTYRGT